jgi:hypothetical protein
LAFALGRAEPCSHRVRSPFKTPRGRGQRRSAAQVESRMSAVAWAMRQRSVSHPRSSNRTYGLVPRCIWQGYRFRLGIKAKHAGPLTLLTQW